MATLIRLPDCQTCNQQVQLPAGDIVLHLDNANGGHSYTWICPHCNAPGSREAHSYAIENLKQAGANVVGAADQLAFDLEDDDAIDAELDTWEET